MAQDRGRKGRGSGRRPQGVFEETLQVRVRRKNPLIERKISENDHHDTTLASFGDVADDDEVNKTRPAVIERSTTRAERSKATARARAKALFDDENSETTQEFGDLQETLRAERDRQHQAEEDSKKKKRTRSRSSAGKKRARPPSPKRAASGPHFDEDATEIADHPPTQSPVAIPDPAEIVRTERNRAGSPKTKHIIRDPSEPTPDHSRGHSDRTLEDAGRPRDPTTTDEDSRPPSHIRADSTRARGDLEAGDEDDTDGFDRAVHGTGANAEIKTPAPQSKSGQAGSGQESSRAPDEGQQTGHHGSRSAKEPAHSAHDSRSGGDGARAPNDSARSAKDSSRSAREDARSGHDGSRASNSSARSTKESSGHEGSRASNDSARPAKAGEDTRSHPGGARTSPESARSATAGEGARSANETPRARHEGARAPEGSRSHREGVGHGSPRAGHSGQAGRLAANSAHLESTDFVNGRRNRARAPDPNDREPPRLESGESAILDRGPRAARQDKATAAVRPIQARNLEPKPTPIDVAGAVPRHLLGKWGTDAVGAAAQRANIARLDESLPQARSPALKMLRSELSREEIASLETALSGAFDERGVEPSLSPKRSLEHLINEAAYNELSLSERARLLKAIATDPRDISTTKAAIAVLKTGIAKRLRLDERDKLFTLFLALTSETRALLARLTARPLRTRSAIEDRDFKDTGLVTNLHELVTETQIHPEMERAGVRRSRVLTLVLSSLAHPERLPFEEGNEGVLSMFEFALADASPAELSRMWLQLVAGEMRADLAGEGELDLAARVRAPAGITFSSRDTPLRIALEHLAILARPRKGLERIGFVMPGGHGVDADVISRALSFLYGASFTVAAGAPTALRHLLRIESEPYRVPPIFVTLLYERGERVFIFDHLDKTNVYLRAPHGRSTKRKGAQRTDPPRTVEDSDAGIDIVSREEFEKLIGVALIPRL